MGLLLLARGPQEKFVYSHRFRLADGEGDGAREHPGGERHPLD